MKEFTTPLFPEELMSIVIIDEKVIGASTDELIFRGNDKPILIGWKVFFNPINFASKAWRVGPRL